MPRKLPSELETLTTPVGTDILIGQRLPEAKAKQFPLSDIITLAQALPGGCVTTTMLALGAVSNMAYNGISAGSALNNYFDSIVDVNITLLEAYSYVLVFGYFIGYGSRSSGTGDYGVETRIERVGGSVLQSGYPAFATGGASSAATIGGSIQHLGVYWTGATPATKTFRLSAKYVPGNSGYCVGGNILALEMRR